LKSLWAAVLLATSCSVAPVEFLGKRCRSDAACGEGLICAEGVCDSSPLAVPLRAAFYKLDFPEDSESRFSPSLGSYRSDTPAVLAEHVKAFEYGKLRAGIVSWDGPGTLNDERFQKLLDASNRSTVRWALYYEPEVEGDPDVATLQAHIDYVLSRYGGHPNFLRLEGRFVMFVRTDGSDDCATVQKWLEANATGQAFLVPKVFSNYRDCAGQPDSWHQHGSSTAESSQTPYSFSISPGYWSTSESAPRLSYDASRWAGQVQQLRDSNADFQLVASFNDWHDGNAVESAVEWESESGFGVYLDVLHQH